MRKGAEEAKAVALEAHRKVVKGGEGGETMTGAATAQVNVGDIGGFDIGFGGFGVLLGFLGGFWVFFGGFRWLLFRYFGWGWFWWRDVEGVERRGGGGQGGPDSGNGPGDCAFWWL